MVPLSPPQPPGAAHRWPGGAARAADPSGPVWIQPRRPAADELEHHGDDHAHPADWLRRPAGLLDVSPLHAPARTNPSPPSTRLQRDDSHRRTLGGGPAPALALAQSGHRLALSAQSARRREARRNRTNV